MYSNKEFFVLLFFTSLLGYAFWRSVEFIVFNLDIADIVLEDE